MRTKTILLSVLIITLPFLTEAAGAPRTFKELSGTIFSLLTAGIGTLVALGLVIFLWGIASNMTKLSQGEGPAYRAYIFWGVIIIFVMVSVLGIVKLVASTIFTGSNPQIQQQQPAPSSLLNG